LTSIRDIEQAYDKVAQHYDTLFVDDESLVENAAAFALVRESSRGTLIDLGCGTGLVLEDPDGWRAGSYFGIDISAGMLRQAKTKFPMHRFIKADMLRLGCRARAFGTAVSLFMGANYVNLTTLGRELSRVLVPKGTILLIVRQRARVKEVPGILFPPYIYDPEKATRMLAPFFDVDVSGLTKPLDEDLWLVIRGVKRA